MFMFKVSAKIRLIFETAKEKGGDFGQIPKSRYLGILIKYRFLAIRFIWIIVKNSVLLQPKGRGLVLLTGQTFVEKFSS